MSDNSLALNHFQRLQRRAPKRPLRNTTLTWALVALVHVLFFLMLTVAGRQTLVLQRPLIETIFTLATLPRGDAPKVILIRPDVPSTRPPMITTAPTLVPPPLEFTVPPQTPADVLRAIGEALSCGASNFENLTQAERARCHRTPWIARRLANGTLVLEAPPRLNEPTTRVVTGAEQLRRDMMTAPACAPLSNAPCIDDMFSGRNAR